MFTLLTIGQTESNLTNIQHRVLMGLPLAIFMSLKGNTLTIFHFLNPTKENDFYFQVHNPRGYLKSTKNLSYIT